MPPQPVDPSKIDFRRYYFWGTVLNVPPILLMYPMRTVRLLQQRKSAIPVSSSIFKVMKDVQQKNGFRSLFAGATVFSAGLTATKILQFATFDYTVQVVKENDYFGMEMLRNPNIRSGILGTFSAVITTFFVVPFDMVSQQITLAKAGAPGTFVACTTSTASAVPVPVASAGSAASATAAATASASKIPIYVAGSFEPLQPVAPMPIKESLKLQFKQEGFRFLFRGTCATLMSTIPFFAAYFPAYELSRVWVIDGINYVRARQVEQTGTQTPFPPPELHQLIISSVAGCMASLAGVIISSPSDMVKTRIQTEQRLQPTNGSGVKLPMPSLKWMDVFMEILRKEGFAKFFAGTKARAILAVPGGALNFVIFDFVRSISKKEPTTPLLPSMPAIAAGQELASYVRCQERMPRMTRCSCPDFGKFHEACEHMYLVTMGMPHFKFRLRPGVSADLMQDPFNEMQGEAVEEEDEARVVTRAQRLTSEDKLAIAKCTATFMRDLE
ncbi:mitochondrial aspartate-glutamate transporter agc1 [Podila epigama]|nr:mitochondrial aspartate-glutamate transporter agc1 [Podila epigama]